MEVYTRILDEIEGFEYHVHRNDEEDFSFLGNDGYSIEVYNSEKKEEDSLFVEYDNRKYTIYFADNYEEFFPEYEEDVYFMLKEISALLHNKKCSVSLYYNTDGFLKCMSGGFMSSKELKDKDVKEVFRYIYMNKDLKDKLEINGGRADYKYFDDSLNRSVTIEKTKK